MSSTTTAQTITSALQSEGLDARNYGYAVDSIAREVDNASSSEAKREVIRRRASQYRHLVTDGIIDAVTSAVVGNTHDEPVAEDVSVDHLTDAQVSALVEVASKAGYRGGEEGLRSEFVSAGLLPEPVVEEPVVEDDKSLLQRLAEFAKGFGFKG